MNQHLINCPICDNLIGESQQTISVSYGFGDHMPVIHNLLFHKRCVADIDVVHFLDEYYEMDTI